MKRLLGSLPRTWPAVVVGIIALILAIALTSRGGEPEMRPRATPEVGASATTAASPSVLPSGGQTATTDGTSTVPADRLPPIAYADLPAEAHDTIELIDRGGPYPYDRDGAVFSNRERRLPQLPRGAYREYTVKTPGENDRGARRIVAARDGTLYYTDDHYETFRRVER